MVEITTQLRGDDQRRKVTCLPLRKLPGWLMTIYPNKVRPEIRDLPDILEQSLSLILDVEHPNAYHIGCRILAATISRLRD